MATTANKQEGISRVIENNPVSYAEMKSFAQNWIARQPPNAKFTWEQIRKDFEASHTIGHYNLCGGLMNNLAKAKVVKKAGHAQAKRQPAHGRDMNLWKRFIPTTVADNQIPMFS